MRNSILKNTGLNKLSKNEYDVYNTLQKYRKKDDKLQLLISSCLAGNKSKDLYNKINELLYKNYKVISLIKTISEYYKYIIIILYIMTELILNSNEHKVDVNKLRYEFKSPIRFENSFISLTQGIFYNFFHNVKQNYEMKVKKDNTFYNIFFIDSMLEVEDINKIINDELIRHKLLTEDDPDIISIIADINTFKIIILVERGYELHLDDKFSRMLAFSYRILKKDLQRNDLTPQIDRINYLKIYSNIIDNKHNPYYLSSIFIKSNVSELTVYNENNIYKKQKIINDIFYYIEIEIFDEENEKIEMTDYFSVSLYIH